MLRDCRVPLANLLGAEGDGLRDRAGAARAGAHPPLHALDRHLRARLRPDVRARREPASSRRASRWARGRWCRSGSPRAAPEIDAARLMVLHAAWKIEQEGGDGGARGDLRSSSSTWPNVLQRVLDRAIQAHGALGMTDDTPLAFWYGHERAARIYDGADEVHKSSLAKRILERYGLKKAEGGMSTPEWMDRTRPVRPGEELDVAWLETYLAEKVPGADGATGGGAVPERALEPDLPAADGRAGAGAAPAAVRSQGHQGRARHGPRVPHPQRGCCRCTRRCRGRWSSATRASRRWARRST